MEDYTFNTPDGQTVGREKLMCFLNTGTAQAPTWSKLGIGTDSSNMEYDWQRETKKDIYGNTYSTMKKPTVTQPFDSWNLRRGDPAMEMIYKLAIVKQDAQALNNLDLLIVHGYAEGADSKALFAERNPSSSIEVTSLGGEGGGVIDMPFTATYGGKRATGTATLADDGAVTFTGDES